MNYPDFFRKQDRRIESEEVTQKKIEALIRAMTPEEKLSLCHGEAKNPEDVGQMGNGGYMPGLPRLGVPEIRMYDGPAGVTSVYETTGLPVQQILASTWSPALSRAFGTVMGSENVSFSGNCQLGAQFDINRIPHFGRGRDMLGEDPVLAGEMAAEQTQGIQAEGAVATLKHFAAYTQSGSPLASADCQIGEQTLHEMYLRPFEAACAKGGAAAIMCTYNKINGKWAASNSYLHQYVLRDLWGFQGAVMSDWGATHRLCTHLGMDIEMPYGMYNSNERILKGIDEGKMTWTDVDNACRHVLNGLASCGYLSLVRLDADGEVMADETRTIPIHTTDTYAEDVKNGLLDKNAETAYEVDIKGITLLKNDSQMLPLQETDTIAAIGLGAVNLVSGYDQERSFGRINRMISPADALGQQLPNVTSAVAIDVVGSAIPQDALYQDAACTKPGLIRSYGISEADGECPPNFGPGGAGQEFNGVPVFAEDDADDDHYEVDMAVSICTPNAAADMPGQETGTRVCVDDRIEFLCKSENPADPYHNGPEGTAFGFGDAYTWKGYLRVPESGTYTLAIHAIGGQTAFRIALDGENYEFVGNTNTREGTHWAWGGIVPTKEGMDIQSRLLYLEAEKAYPILVFARGTMPHKDLQVRLAWITPAQKKLNYETALKAAATNKKVLLFVNSKKEAESGMMTFPVTTVSLRLPDEQEQLLADVIRTAKEHGNRVAVCLFNSVPVVMEHWIDDVDAVVEAWLPGQEGGRALADLLTGKRNFTGKLAQSLPRNDDDTLITDTPEHKIRRHDGFTDDGNHLVVEFSEGIFFGYRWYDITGRKPMFPFGYGLSYTTYTYSNPQVNISGRNVSVSVDITNSGTVSGDEIVQVYIGAGTVPAYAQVAKKQLVAFQRVEALQPGECKRITLHIDPRNLCFWDKASEVAVSSWGTLGKWLPVTGEREVFVGGSSQDLLCAGTIKIS